MRKSEGPLQMGVSRAGADWSLSTGFEVMDPGEIATAAAASVSFAGTRMKVFLRPLQRVAIYAQAIADEVGTDQVAVRLFGIAIADAAGVVSIVGTPDIVVVDPGALLHTLDLAAAAAVPDVVLGAAEVQVVAANANAVRWAAAGWSVALSAA